MNRTGNSSSERPFEPSCFTHSSPKVQTFGLCFVSNHAAVTAIYWELSSVPHSGANPGGGAEILGSHKIQKNKLPGLSPRPWKGASSKSTRPGKRPKTHNRAAASLLRLHGLARRARATAPSRAAATALVTVQQQQLSRNLRRRRRRRFLHRGEHNSVSGGEPEDPLCRHDTGSLRRST